jgi:hypothetical protein
MDRHRGCPQRPPRYEPTLTRLLRKRAITFGINARARLPARCASVAASRCDRAAVWETANYESRRPPVAQMKSTGALRTEGGRRGCGECLPSYLIMLTMASLLAPPHSTAKDRRAR